MLVEENRSLVLTPISPGKMLAAIAQHLQLARLVAVAVRTETSHDLVHGLSGRFVLVEEVAGKQNHVHITLFGRTHDLIECFPTIVAANRVSFAITDMVVCCNQDTDGIFGCESSVMKSIGSGV